MYVCACLCVYPPQTVDPRDKKSTKVLQLETAMGSAIECFEGAAAILIPRTRFAPVKTTADLLALSSDAYEETSDHRMMLRAERRGVPPLIKLSGEYKFVDNLNSLIPQARPDQHVTLPLHDRYNLNSLIPQVRPDQHVTLPLHHRYTTVT